MRSTYIILIILLTTFHLSCEKKKLQYFEYSEIQSLVLDSVIGKPSVRNRDSAIINYKPVLNIHIVDSLELSYFKKDKDFFKVRWLDTTDLFVREEFQKLIQSNEIIVLKDSAERKLNLTTTNYTLNVTKIRQDNYFSNDTIGELTFYPLLYNNTCTNAIQICRFYKGHLWGFGKIYFLKKINGNWNIVGRNMLYIS